MYSMVNVQDYDSIKYDYREYWKDREYENISERNAISHLLGSGNIFIDIGGGYGRLSDLYREKYKQGILFDYSLKNLQNAKVEGNIIKVCGDVYNLPFKDHSIDSGMMIRVLHHIEDPQKAISEISRVISNNFILEFANKNHFLARIKHRKDKDFLLKDVFEIPHNKDSQGFITSQIFLNFRFEYIRKIVLENGFSIQKLLSVSNFRQRTIKKIIPLKVLIFIENIFHSFFSKMLFGPSIFLELKSNIINDSKFINIEDILICPKCRNGIKNGSCINCKKNYLKNSIYNFK